MATTRMKHVVLFPFPGQGYLAGFLAFVGLLRRELPDAIVTLVSTPRNVAALSSSAVAESSSIGLHTLPFVPADDGLTAGCESTSSLPLHEFMKLFEAFDALEPAFDGYVSGLIGESEDAGATVCIVADTFVAWTLDVARHRGCAHAFFASCGAFGTAILHALWKNMPALPFGPDGALRLPVHPEVVLHRSQLSQVFLHGAGRPTASHHRHLPSGSGSLAEGSPPLLIFFLPPPPLPHPKPPPVAAAAALPAHPPPRRRPSTATFFLLPPPPTTHQGSSPIRLAALLRRLASAAG
ncbi:hypothetical protein C2845_PM18G07140 [Panicum miliaceum]|uniref:Uncharacterized protein n=1 Tax=Panicum miliaceum TaxID=4540 RepID=A0A3L6PJ92_PANMI|nr:hypothetical protein C2845_PM18G07140 [Panicum miliaceum]